MAIGFVYILSNPAMPGQVKIGYTTQIPDIRASELSAPTGIPQPFVVEFWCLTGDPERIERETHERLAEVRVNGKREFFQLSVEAAIAALESLVNPVPNKFKNPNRMPSSQSKKTSARCLRCGGLMRAGSCWSCGTPARY